MPIILCDKRLICDCTDDPVSNFSSEDPDALRFRSLNYQRAIPRLGWNFSNLGCISLCESTVSQMEADDCAARQAIICDRTPWVQPEPPNPPDPPNPNPPIPPTIFFNQNQFCAFTCPDGSSFTWLVAAGTVAALSQIEADAQALSLACNRARTQGICITSSSPLEACINTAFSQRLLATGGIGIPWPHTGVPAALLSACNSDPHQSTFAPIKFDWQIVAGALPPGLSLRRCSGFIEGTPTAAGTYAFTIRVTDRAGSFQTKSFTFCVFEITSASPLPSGTVNTAYSQSLSTNPNPATESWSVLAGTLPPGLTLDATTGIISGTPTTAGTFNFTVQLVATCS